MKGQRLARGQGNCIGRPSSLCSDTSGMLSSTLFITLLKNHYDCKLQEDQLNFVADNLEVISRLNDHRRYCKPATTTSTDTLNRNKMTDSRQYTRSLPAASWSTNTWFALADSGYFLITLTHSLRQPQRPGLEHGLHPARKPLRTVQRWQKKNHRVAQIISQHFSSQLIQAVWPTWDVSAKATWFMTNTVRRGDRNSSPPVKVPSHRSLGVLHWADNYISNVELSNLSYPIGDPATLCK